MSTIYSYNDLIRALKSVGMEQGDTIFIHSNIGFFGKAENVKSSDQLADFFFRALKESVGSEGNIICPSFTYSFCHDEIFDPAVTASNCGMLSEYMRKQDDVLRSLDPNFSIVAWGKNAKEYTKVLTHESFGAGSFWERLLHTQKSKILCMNYDCGTTFLHYVEKMSNVPYRYNKAFNGKMIVNGHEKKDYFVHWVYDLEKKEDASNTKLLSDLCKEKGICKTSYLGRGVLHCMDVKEYYELIQNELKEHPRFLTKGGD